MGKSVTATLMGVLIQQGVYTLDQPAPIPEWQSARRSACEDPDPDLLHMSSGIRIKAPQDPDFDPNGTYPDHLYLYTGRRQLVPVRRDAAAAMAAEHGRPLSQHRSGADQLPRSASRVEKRGEDYLVVSAAQRCSTRSGSARW